MVQAERADQPRLLHRTKNKSLFSHLERNALRRVEKGESMPVVVADLCAVFTNSVFARATDWVIELCPA
eukprot:6089465-Lingulodinium_polyedra.AAC.1